MARETVSFDPRYPGIVFCPRKHSIWPAHLPEGVRDYPSILVVNGTPADYSEEELRALDHFGQAVTKNYDDTVGGRHGHANFYEIEKMEHGHSWLTRKLTWTMGRMFSPTLADGLSFLGEPFGYAGLPAQPKTVAAAGNEGGTDSPPTP